MGRTRRSSPGPYLLHLELVRERILEPDRFPYCLPAVRGLTTLPFHPRVTFLVGENGSGKSTLLEGVAVACGLNAEGGEPQLQLRDARFAFAARGVPAAGEDCGAPWRQLFFSSRELLQRGVGD